MGALILDHKQLLAVARELRNKATCHHRIVDEYVEDGVRVSETWIKNNICLLSGEGLLKKRRQCAIRDLVAMGVLVKELDDFRIVLPKTRNHVGGQLKRQRLSKEQLRLFGAIMKCLDKSEERRSMAFFEAHVHHFVETVGLPLLGWMVDEQWIDNQGGKKYATYCVPTRQRGWYSRMMKLGVDGLRSLYLSKGGNGVHEHMTMEELIWMLGPIELEQLDRSEKETMAKEYIFRGLFTTLVEEVFTKGVRQFAVVTLYRLHQQFDFRPDETRIVLDVLIRNLWLTHHDATDDEPEFCRLIETAWLIYNELMKKTSAELRAMLPEDVGDFRNKSWYIYELLQVKKFDQAFLDELHPSTPAVEPPPPAKPSADTEKPNKKKTGGKRGQGTRLPPAEPPSVVKIVVPQPEPNPNEDAPMGDDDGDAFHEPPFGGEVEILEDLDEDNLTTQAVGLPFLTLNRLVREDLHAFFTLLRWKHPELFEFVRDNRLVRQHLAAQFVQNLLPEADQS